ncbi:hypothetical protein DFH27DRAFT_521926 [Peziza echinospora]|nr:hypothetical protein DFH27DRAFT_521926 [Peziza echinospora]
MGFRKRFVDFFCCGSLDVAEKKKNEHRRKPKSRPGEPMAVDHGSEASVTQVENRRSGSASPVVRIVSGGHSAAGGTRYNQPAYPAPHPTAASPTRMPTNTDRQSPRVTPPPASRTPPSATTSIPRKPLPRRNIQDESARKPLPRRNMQDESASPALHEPVAAAPSQAQTSPTPPVIGQPSPSSAKATKLAERFTEIPGTGPNPEPPVKSISRIGTDMSDSSWVTDAPSRYNSSASKNGAPPGHAFQPRPSGIEGIIHKLEKDNKLTWDIHLHIEPKSAIPKPLSRMGSIPLSHSTPSSRPRKTTAKGKRAGKGKMRSPRPNSVVLAGTPNIKIPTSSTSTSTISPPGTLSRRGSLAAGAGTVRPQSGQMVIPYHIQQMFQTLVENMQQQQPQQWASPPQETQPNANRKSVTFEWNSGLNPLSQHAPISSQQPSPRTVVSPMRRNGTFGHGTTPIDTTVDEGYERDNTPPPMDGDGHAHHYHHLRHAQQKHGNAPPTPITPDPNLFHNPRNSGGSIEKGKGRAVGGGNGVGLGLGVGVPKIVKKESFLDLNDMPPGGNSDQDQP